MGKKSGSKSLKRLSAPKHWDINRKSHTVRDKA